MSELKETKESISDKVDSKSAETAAILLHDTQQSQRSANPSDGKAVGAPQAKIDNEGIVFSPEKEMVKAGAEANAVKK